METECKTIKEAIMAILNTVAQLIGLENVKGDEEVSLQSDKQLYQQPEHGTFVVNQLFSIGKLDFDGNIAVENKVAKLLEQKGVKNFNTGSDDMCDNYGYPLYRVYQLSCNIKNRYISVSREDNSILKKNSKNLLENDFCSCKENRSVMKIVSIFST